jgi:hypothetical protein
MPNIKHYVCKQGKRRVCDSVQRFVDNPAVPERVIDRALQRMRALGMKRQADLARKLEIDPQLITNWKSREMPASMHQRVAEALDWSVDQLLGRVHPTEDIAKVAHELSLSPFDHAEPITWEAVLNWRSAALPSRFILEMPDDSLASTVPRGTRLLFETGAAPRPRWGVLVADRDGLPYVRRYVQGRGSEFTAEADRGYLTLESVRDDLMVLAVLVHRMTDGEV